MIDEQADMLPLYYRVYRVLEERILDGTYPSGGRVGTEAELIDEFRVSRATVRQALSRLAASGLVAAKHGRGTFVLPRQLPPPGASRFRGSLAELLEASSTPPHELRLLRIESGATLPGFAIKKLGLGEDDTRGTIVRRLTMSGDVAYAYHVNFLPSRYGDMIREADLRTEGVLSTLSRRGAELEHAVQRIQARSADPETSQYLDLPLGSAVLFAERMVRSRNGHAVELARSTYPGTTHEFIVEFGSG